MAQQMKQEYILKAVYEGKGEIGRLRGDLNALGKIEAMKKLGKDVRELTTRFNEAKTKLEAQAAAMRSADTVTKEMSTAYKAAQREVTSLATALDKKTAAFKGSTAAARAAGVDTGKLVSEEKRLALASQETGKMWAARQALGVRSHRDIRSEVSKLNLAYNTLKTSGTASALEIFQAKQRLKEKTRELTDSNLTWGASFSKVQTSVVALAGVGYGLVKTFQEFAGFETGMAEVNTLLNVSTERFAALKKETKDVIGDLPQQSKDLTKALYDIISAGVPLDKSTQVLKLAAKAATAGITETKVAAGIGVGAMNAYGKGVDDLEGIYDTLFNTVKLGVTTFPELAQSIGDVLPTARAAGVDLDNVTSAIAALTLAGIKTPQAATAMRGAILAMAAPTPEAKKKFEELGITWQGLLPTLEAIKKKGLSIDQMRELIPDQEAATGILALTQNLDKFTTILGSMDEAGGSMEGAYKKMADTPDFEIQMMKKSVSELGVSIGHLSSMIIVPAAKLLGVFADAVNESSVPVKAFISLLGGVGTTALLWKLGLSQAVEGVAMLIAKVSSSAVVISAYTGTVSAARAGMIAFTTAMAANPIAGSILVTLAIGATAWALFGKSSLEASKDHAAAAKEIGEGRKEIDKEIASLEKLRVTLDNTAPGSKEHIEAERELAQLLPDVNLAYDEQGRLIGKVGDATSENSKKLDEHIRLLKEQSGLSLSLQVEQQANAYQKASKAVERYKVLLKNMYGIAAEGDDAAASSRQKWNLYIQKLTGTFEENVKAGAKVEANAREQKSAYDDLISSIAKTGITAEQLSTSLDKAKVSAELKASIISDYKKLAAAQTDVADAAKDANKKIVAGATLSAEEQKKAQKKGLDAMKERYKQYADEIKRLQDDIGKHQDSVADQLRDMARSGMSDLGAWKDLKKQAGEYEAAARSAAKAGAFDAAVGYADKAREMYAQLNTEVKKGEQVLISQPAALKVAMDGVKRAGEIASDAMSQQMEKANKGLESLTHLEGFEEMSKDMSVVEKEWLENWLNMREGATSEISKVKAELQSLPSDVDIKVHFTSSNEIKWPSGVSIDGSNPYGHALGGLIGLKMQLGGRVGALQHLAAGGSVLRNALNGLQLGGYGGGDRRLILGEDGEVMIRKESVRAAGDRAALAFNAGRWDIVVAELISRFKMNIGDIAARHYGSFADHASAVLDVPQHLATGGMVGVGGSGGMVGAGGSVGKTININLTLPGSGSPVRVQADRANASELIRQLRRMQRLKS